MGPRVGTDDTPALGTETVAGVDPGPPHLQDTQEGDPQEGRQSDGEPDGPYAEQPAPSRIGRYLLLGMLGSGGMGMVHAAYDPKLDRRIALKILHPAARRSPNSRGRLLREAQAMARLSHPNVVTVHDVGEHEGRVFLAMESIEGRTLTQWLADQERSVRAILGVFVQAAQGLAAAHDKGLVHRDFKPDNVMVGDDGRVRVMDFGLARPSVYNSEDLEPSQTSFEPAPSSFSNPVTVQGALVGTPMYMAPEQWSGADVDARTDQFSFCVALYQALYGELPFEGDNLGSLALAVTGGAPRAQPTTLSIPSAVIEGWQRGLSTDPADRFPSMAPLLVLLRRDPTRTRRRLLVLGGVVGALGLVSGARLYQHSREVSQCEREASVLAEVWGAHERENVEQAFRRSGVSYAGESFERVVPVLDRYASEWKTLRQSVCTDGLEVEQRTPAQNELAADCLATRRREFETLVSELEQGTPAIVRDGIVVAANLPAVSLCVDEVSLHEGFEAPADPGEAEAVDRVRERIEAARRRYVVADYEGVVTLATEALEEAEAIGQAGLQALARATLADGQYNLGHLTEAELGYRDAFRLALASGRTSLASEAARGLARVLGLDRSRPEDGLRWIDIAAALDTRLGREFGDIHRLRGMLLTDAGDPRLAEQEMDRAVELDEAEYGLSHPKTVVSLQTRCSVYSALGRYDDAIACNERALEFQTQYLGPSHPTIAVAKHNIGGLYARMGRLPLAHEAVQAGLDIRERALGPEHVDVAKSLLTLGAVTAMMGDVEDAEAQLVRAIHILEKTVGPDDPVMARGLVNLANLQLELNDFGPARTSAERAVSIQESVLGPDHPQLINSLSVLASIEQEEGDLVAAERVRRRELALAESQPGADPVPANLTRLNLGSLLSKQGRHDEARALLKPTLETLTAQLGPAHPHVASCELALARVLAVMQETEQAVEHARRAHEIRQAALGSEHDETVAAHEFVQELEGQRRELLPPG